MTFCKVRGCFQPDTWMLCAVLGQLSRFHLRAFIVLMGVLVAAFFFLYALSVCQQRNLFDNGTRITYHFCSCIVVKRMSHRQNRIWCPTRFGPLLEESRAHRVVCNCLSSSLLYATSRRGTCGTPLNGGSWDTRHTQWRHRRWVLFYKDIRGVCLFDLKMVRASCPESMGLWRRPKR